MNESFKQKMKRRTNLDIKIISARLGCAKEEIIMDNNLMIRINFIRKNNIKKTEERMRSKKVKLKDSLMYFNEELINFTDIDSSNDILEISLSIINEKEKQFQHSTIRIRDLIIDKEKDEIWTLNMQSLINIKYKVYHEYVKDILADLSFLNDLNIESKNKIKSDDNLCENNTQKIKYEVKVIEPNDNNKDKISYKFSSPPKKHSFNCSSSPNILNLNFSVSKETKKFSIPSNDGVSIILNNLNQIKLNNSKMNSKSKSLITSSNFFSGEIIDCDLLDSSQENNLTNYQTFCEAFFVSGLPFQDGKMIQDWEVLKSSCGHKDCSILPAYRPDILFKYQKKESNLEIRNITAGLCFPNGIKLCYGIDKKNPIQTIKTFMNVITNEKGETFYLLNFFYYKLIDYESFNKLFNYDPVREYLKIITNGVKIEKELQICSNFILSQHKYIPECISLISKFPYAKQMEKCLQTIYKLIIHNDRINTTKINFNPSEEMINLLSHLINEVPIPPINKKLMFYIPFNLIEIPSIYMKEIPLINFPLRVILDEFSIENIIFIYNLIILEQKIIFIHEDYSKLSEVSQSFLNLIQPFTWVNTFIPVLSDDLIKYLQSFIPFVMGLDENLLNLSYKLRYLDPDENNKIFMININKKLTFLSTHKKDKKFSKKNLSKEGIPELPLEVVEMLTSELKSLKKILDDSKNKNNLNNERVDNTMREIFMKAMVMMIGDYKKYVNYSEEDQANFNHDSFFINRPKDYKKFYQEFTQTQIFKEFLQREKRENKNKNQFSNYNYFNHMCTRHINLINPIRIKSKRSSSVSQNDLINQISNSDSFRRDGLSLSKKEYSSNSKVSPNLITLKKDNSIFLDYSDSLNSKSENLNENTASNTKDLTDCFLITPYFIDNPICKFDPQKIEEIMKQKFNQNEISEDELIKRILINQFSFCESKTKNKMRRYHINEMNTFTSDNKLNESFSNSNLNSNLNLNDSNYLIGNEIKVSETVMTTINESLNLIFSNGINNIKYESVKKILALRQGRFYLANCINNLIVRENKCENIFSLSLSSFNDLSKLINTFLIFSEDSNKEFKEIRIVTKATFYYYKSDANSKKINYIYEELSKKQISIWQSDNLWVRWFELEVEEERLNNVFPNMEDFYFTVLLKLAQYMTQLGLKLNKITKCIIQKIAPIYLNKSKESSLILIKELEESLNKQSQRV